MNNLTISHISQISVNKTELVNLVNPMITKKSVEQVSGLLSLTKQELEFDAYKDYLEIKLKNRSPYPVLIEIDYHTRSSGNSLSWGKTSEEFGCVFTAGSPLNNRSLLPCQDAPGAMATWEACILMQRAGYHVSMTGDETASITNSSDLLKNLFNPFIDVTDIFTTNYTAHYFYTSLVLPIATIALAIGKWRVKRLSYPDSVGKQLKPIESVVCEHLPYICQVKKCRPVNETPLTVVYEHNFEETLSSFFSFLPYCAAAAVDILGPYPCPRVEFVILPQSFSSLGLASPNVVFLNPSVVTANDSFTFLRVCHEISHAWFGIITGPEDWTQEWLSEGFATYLEESIYSRAVTLYRQTNPPSFPSLNPKPAKICKVVKPLTGLESFIGLPENVQNDLKDIRDRLRLSNLRQEVDCVSSSLMTLVPTNNSEKSVPDALNRDKTHLKVHYLKGYFLLKFLCSIIGEEKFLRMLKSFILFFHGQLITSQDFTDFTLQTFPDVLSISRDNFEAKWFTSSDLKDCDFILADENVLHSNCLQLVNLITKKKCTQKTLILNPFYGPDQLQIFLELLINHEGYLQRGIMKNVFEFYEIEKRNCEVRHSWCELVIKQNYKAGINSVGTFLSSEFAMGVYLFGELMITAKDHWVKLAREMYTKNCELMEQSARETVREMIYT